jgi:hypothetical protein
VTLAMGTGLLIDDNGREWPDDSWDLARRIGYADPKADVSLYAVRERGFIHIRPQRRGVRVTLCEGRFNLLALTGTMLALGRVRPPQIVLSVLGDGVTSFRLFNDLHDFCAEVEPMASGKPLEIRLPRLSERRSLHVLNLAPFASVWPIVDVWRRTRGELTEEVEDALKAGGVLHRMNLARQPFRSSRLISEYFGSGIRHLRPCEALLAIGRDLHERPDREYGVWIAQAYDEVSRGSSIRLESIRALIGTSDGLTLRTRYDRVLMPWHRRGGDTFVMGVSIQRQLPVPV